jgi:azurin
MHIRPHAIGFFIAVMMISNARAAKTTEIRIETGPGLKYDITRFVVEPGVPVRLIIHNVDEMQHNLVITQPGTRTDIVNAALAMGVDGMVKHFVPDSPKVLWATPLLNAEQTVTLEFTAPKEAGVYPYVCTFPGHGILMYGAMYVGRDVKLPPLETDPNVPPPLEAAAGMDHMHHGPTDDQPHVQRTFMPDCGPAAIAVDLGGGRSYCFDAGSCRLRYAWTGGFVDIRRHMAGNGDAFADVIGRIWYRAGDAFPLRIGTDDRTSQVEFLGYRLVDRVPEFRYRVDGVEVHQRITLPPDGGGGGLVQRFVIAPTRKPVRYTVEPHTGAAFSAIDRAIVYNTLSIDATRGARFAVVMSPQPPPEALPLKYYSCNDTLWTGKPLPVEGVVGRAMSFHGTEKKPQQVDTGIDAEALAAGGTIMAWVKLDKKSEALQTIVGAADGDQLFGLFVDGKSIQFRWNDDQMHAAIKPATGAWRHVAVTSDAAKLMLYLDGERVATRPAEVAPPATRMHIGGIDKQHQLQAKLDEIRIDNRAWTAEEIAAIYRQETPR